MASLTAAESEAYTKSVLKEAGFLNADGTIDSANIAKTDPEIFRTRVNNAMYKEVWNSSGNFDKDEAALKLSNIIDQVRQNSSRYEQRKASAQLDDNLTGSKTANDVKFSPYAGVDFNSSNGKVKDDNDPTDDPDYSTDDEFNDEDLQNNFSDPGSYSNPGNDPNSTTNAAGTTPSAAGGNQDNASVWKGVKDTNVIKWYMAYGIAAGGFRNYDSYREALANHMSRLMDNSDDPTGGTTTSTSPGDGKVSDGESSASDEENVNMEKQEGERLFYLSPSVSDASIGGNDAINPYAAFNPDDDIIHDVSRAKNGDVGWGMGRCYGEIYESKQQILYLTMGLPKYRNLQEWLKNATNKEMSEMNDIGEQHNFSIGRLITGGIKLAIALPWLPIRWAVNIVNGIKEYKVTEYFYFRDNMPLFYRYCNSFLSEVAVGMGIYGNGDVGGPEGNGSSGGTDGSTNKPAGQSSTSNGSNMSTTQASQYSQNMPEILKEGPDIFKIMCRRAKRASISSTISTDDMIEQYEGHFNEMNEKDKDPNAWKTAQEGLSNFWSGIKAGALEGMNFIGFRIEKSDNANESFSNTLQDSPLLQTLNAKVAEVRARHLDEIGQGQGAMASMLSGARNIGAAISNTSQAIQNVKNMFKGDMAGLGDTIAYAASGNGFFDLPKQWAGSSGMSRSINVNLKLRAKTGGDNVSIFQSIMIPLSILICAALPRAVGDSSYTSPFIVRAFCKGMYSIPAGIISTLSISRGASEFGWSLARIPTVIDVNMTIEDLSPMLFLSIAGGAGGLDAIKQAFVNNTKMHEYVNTLIGIGAKERYYLMGQLKRRLQTAMLISKNTLFSATYRGYVMGDSAIVRSLMALTPYTWVKNN